MKDAEELTARYVSCIAFIAAERCLFIADDQCGDERRTFGSNARYTKHGNHAADERTSGRISEEFPNIRYAVIKSRRQMTKLIEIPCGRHSCCDNTACDISTMSRESYHQNTHEAVSQKLSDATAADQQMNMTMITRCAPISA